MPHKYGDVLTSFRGEQYMFKFISRQAGKSGKIIVSPAEALDSEREFYPQVFNCFIKDGQLWDKES